MKRVDQAMTFCGARIPTPLWRRIKALSLKSGLRIQAMLRNAIEAYLESAGA